MTRTQKQDPAETNRAVAAVGAERLKKFRRGVPIGTSQATRMAEAARWGQLATLSAVLRLISIVRNPAVSPETQKAAADSILDRFGFPKRSDVAFAGAVVAGSPEDYQKAIDAAVGTFMANREAFRVEAADATIEPIFTEMNGNGNGSGHEVEGALPPDSDQGADRENGAG